MKKFSFSSLSLGMETFGHWTRRPARARRLPGGRSALKACRTRAAEVRFGQELEDRTMLTGNVLASGANLFIQGDAGDNDITIDFDTGAGQYVISDANGPIQALGAIVDLDANPNVVRFDPAGLGTTRVIINPQAGDDTVTLNGLAGAGERVEVRDDPGDGTDIFNLDAALTGINGNSFFQAETINAEGSVTTNGGDVEFRGPVNLTGDLIVDTDDMATVSFDGTIDGTHGLNLNGDSVQIAGDVGAATPLFGFTTVVANGGSVDLGGSVTTGQLFVTANDRILVGGDITVTSGSAQVGAGNQVVLNTPGTIDITSVAVVDISGAIVPSAGFSTSLNLDGDAAFVRDGATVDGSFSASGDILVDTAGGTIQADDITLAGTGATIIQIASLQASVGGISLSGGGSTSLNNGTPSVLISAATSILFDSFVISGNGNGINLMAETEIEVLGPVVNTGAFQAGSTGGGLATVTLGRVTADSIDVDADAAAATLRGDLVATDTDVTLAGNFVVDTPPPMGPMPPPPVLRIMSGGDPGDDIVINGTLDDVIPGRHNLEILAGAGSAQNFDTGLGAGYGLTTPFRSVTASGGTTVTLEGVTVTTGPLILEGGLLNINAPLTGQGPAIFRTQAPGGTLEIHNVPNIPFSAGVTRVDIGDLQNLVPGFSEVIFGGPTTGQLTVFADNDPVSDLDLDSIGLGVDLQFIADTITLLERVDQGDTTGVSFVADTAINFTGQASGDGDVTIRKRTAGPGTLQVNGNIGQQFWGDTNLLIDGNGGEINFNDQVGGSLQDITVTPGTARLGLASPTAVVANGNVDIDAQVTDLNGGIFSGGDISVDGTVNLVGGITVLAPGGSTVSFNNVVANNSRITIRSRDGAGIGEVALDSVADAGILAIDSKNAATANLVSLGDVNADRINVLSNAINLDGDVASTAGSLRLQGDTTLLGDSSLSSTSGNTSDFVQVVGTIDGAFDLTIDSGPASTILNQAVGSTIALMNLTVNSGSSFVLAPITVTNNVSWTVADVNPGVGVDRLRFTSGGSITAGNMIDLEADDITGDNEGVNIVAPTVNLIERGP